MSKYCIILAMNEHDFSVEVIIKRVWRRLSKK